jgi:hypothetical protein
MAKGSGGAGRGGGGAAGQSLLDILFGGQGNSRSPSGNVTAQVSNVIDSLPTGQRITLADIVDRIDAPHAAVSRELRNLQLQGRIALLPIDIPRDITARIQNAAVIIGGDERHILYRLR